MGLKEPYETGPKLEQLFANNSAISLDCLEFLRYFEIFIMWP